MQPYYGQQQIAAYREGDGLAVPKNGQLANVCVKCSSPQVAVHPRKSFSFTPQWTYIVFFVSPLIGLILSAAMRKNASLHVPLCAPCDAEWKKSNRNLALSFLPGVVLFLLGVVLAVADLGDVGGPIILLGVITLIFTPIIVQFSYRKKRTLSTRRIDDRYVVITGLHPLAIDASCMQYQGGPQMQNTVPMGSGMPGQPQALPPHMWR